MPYKDKVKQRAFQREWMRQRTAGKPRTALELIKKSDLEMLEPYKKLSTFKACVAIANHIRGTKKMSRMAIAELAMQSVRIQYGGDRRSQLFKTEKAEKSLRKFADEIEVKYKTLHRWCEINRLAEPVLKKADTFDWTAAEQAVRYASETGRNELELYYLFLKRSELRKGLYIVRYLKYSSSFLKKIRQ
jgi:hypothetical protein